ncbi:MAG: hypothetical protein IK100_11525 [Muribaculaceae bacterium]|nr:hypothetical protein [Muribaculaceae bacterium]
MRQVYIFNPQNDLALATGGINYVAPPFAMQMARDLAVLPAFLAEPDSLLITDNDLDAEWLEHMNISFGLDVHAIKRNELRHLTDYRIMPWGWSLDLRRRLLKWGASSDCLPTKEQINHLRGLSHRRVSILIHMRLKELLGRQLCPEPVELAIADDVLDFVRKHRKCFIKTPWSSSGRGIYHTIDGASPELDQWCRGALKRQGSLLCEQALDKTMDFGVEFYCENDKATFRGYSLFSTDSHSQYDHGIVAEEKELKARITALYPNFDEVVAALTQVLNELIAPHYEGWLGVDMILYNAQCIKHNTQFSNSTLGTGINPCVELNLRPTMGAITSVIGNKMLAPGTTSVFRIEQRSTTNKPWPQGKEAVIKNGHLISGVLQLTPPNPTALYRAVLDYKED